MKRGICLLAALALLLCAAGVAAETEAEDMWNAAWYRQALKDGETRTGNNLRLKRLIERAQSGETITLATIGGSITEGAGAATYEECWASRLWKRFGAAYGVNNGANVEFVNAGVGGTPSTFGLLRYKKEVVDRVPESDPDGLPDLVVVEFAVNDWQEPTGHRCYESLVKEILEQPNRPVVILLYAVFENGFNLQDELIRVAETYDLMAVSIRDAVYPHIGKEIPSKDFFFDQYHPTSMGHRIMSDCLIEAISDAAAAEMSAEDIDLSVPPAYGTDFMGMQTIFGDTELPGFMIERGGYKSKDYQTYHNRPVGWVCGVNFHHDAGDGDEPLRVTGVFRKCLVAWKASPDAAFGKTEILVDGQVVQTVQGAPDKWNQSEVVLVLDDAEPAEHTLEIRCESGKCSTITAIGVE